MNWNIDLLLVLSVALLISAAGCVALHQLWRKRFSAVRAELAWVSEDLSQLVELQADIYRRVNHELSDLEGKVLELSVPSSETPLPLERRHQVLTLTRKGVSVDEIARRLNMPKGEAELILSLRKYADAKTPAAGGSAPLKAYARA
jgi:hypothetical protein